MSTPTDKNNRICIIICHIGKFPWYFDYFAHTCRHNPTVDFLIISDDLTYNKPLPENITVAHMTLAQINSRATEILGFDTCLDTPYKLCDFKPAYGLLFSAFIGDYGFWGHGDIDLIFGDIREFITDAILEEYDAISVRHDYLTGFFLLYRNNSKMNTLFTWSKDHREVYTSSNHYCFDETNHRHRAFTKAYNRGEPPEQVSSKIDSMTHVVHRKDKEGYLRAYFDLHVVEGNPGKLIWEKGKLFYNDRFEVLLYHMIYLKKKFVPKNETGIIPDRFGISRRGIFFETKPAIQT